MRFEEYLEGLERTGWLGDAEADEQSRLRDDLQRAFSGQDRASVEVYEQLAVASFEAECIEEEGPSMYASYYSIIELLADSSFGAFSPEEIHDELDREEQLARVAFNHRGRSYGVEVPWEDDWFQPQVLEEVNRALADAGEKRRFQVLPSRGQQALVAFVSPEVLTNARDAGLLPTEDDLFGY